jgi:uncharacterized membrane protein
LDFGHFEDWMVEAVHGFEALGVLVLVVGSLAALWRYVTMARGNPKAAYQQLRQDIGRAILLGLEILIIADIILTITVEQTIESAATLGIVVLVRTFLSFSLEIELEGAPPWNRASARDAPPQPPDSQEPTPLA